MPINRRVTKVIDGDTFDTANSRIRLAGVNAPELSSPRGPAAKRKLETLILGKVLSIEGVSTSYGRTVAHVYLNGQSVNQMMNRYLNQ